MARTTRTAEFDPELNAEVIRDEQSAVCVVLYPPQTGKLTAGSTPRAVALNFLHEESRVFGIDASQLPVLPARPDDGGSAPGVEYRFLTEKSHSDLSTVIYQQTYQGWPVWQGGIAVHVKQVSPAPNRIRRAI